MKKILLATTAITTAWLSMSCAFASDDAILQRLNAMEQKLALQEKEIAALKTENTQLSKTQAKQTIAIKESKKIAGKKGSGLSVETTKGGLVDEVVYGAVDEHEKNAHASKLKVGGWGDFLYQDRDAKGYEKVLDPHHLYLFFDAKMDAQWRLYGEVEVEHSPSTEAGKGEIRLERLYIEHNYSQLLNGRVGKFNTPLGIWTPAHWAVSVPSIQKPIHEDNAYVPVKQVGGELFGEARLSDDAVWNPNMSYHAWVSAGDQVFGTDSTNNDNVGTGIDVDFTLHDMVKVGTTLYSQRNGASSDRKENTIAPYAELYLPYGVTLTGEYLSQTREGTTDIETWYTSAKWQFHPQAYAYYRLDKGEDVKRGSGDDHTSNIFTLGYSPKPYVKTKLEYSNHNFENSSKEDYNQFGAFIGLIF